MSWGNFNYLGTVAGGTLAPSISIPSGTLILVVGTSLSGGGTMSDTAGNNYQTAPQITNSGNSSTLTIFYAYNCAALSTSGHFSGTGLTRYAAFSLAGAGTTSSPLDDFVTNYNNATSITVGPLKPAGNDEFFFGACWNVGATVSSINSNWTDAAGGVLKQYGLGVGYLINSGPGSHAHDQQSFSASFVSANYNTAVITAFTLPSGTAASPNYLFAVPGI